MVLHAVLSAALVIILFVALALFLGRLFLLVGRRRSTVSDFGIGFSAFLAAWVGSELLGLFIPRAFVETEEIVHFAVMASFAAWMNLRWRWAFRRAQEASVPRA
ncbi:MAG: hypothetical protein ACE5NC_11695 [Anaerolineae bacterium]